MPEIVGLAVPEILGAITGGAGLGAAGLGGLAAAAPEAAAVAAPAAAGAIDVGLPAIAAGAAPLAEGAAALPATAAGLDAGVAGLGAASALDAAGAFGAFGAPGAGAPVATTAPSVLAPAATPSTVTPISSAPLGGGATSAAATAAPSSIGPAASAFPTDVTQAAGAAGGAAPAATTGTTAASPLAGFGSAIAKNPLSLVGAGGLLYNLMQGDKKPKFDPQLEAIAGNAAKQSGQLESYLSSGTLPPGVQTALNSAGESAKATIRSQYATRGMTGSSAEAQDLQNVENTLVSQGATIAQNLYSQGVQQAQLADSVYSELMKTMMAEDQQTASAFGNLAGSMALMSRRAAAA